MIALWTLAASAQVFEEDGFDAHGLKLEALDGDARDPLFVQRPTGLVQGRWWAGGLLEYADRPLVWRATSPDGSVTEDIHMLDDLFALNVSTGVVVVDRVRLEAYVPVFLASRSADEGQGAKFGDLRLAGTVALLDEGLDDALSLGLTPYLDLPTGADDAFLGSASTGGGFKAAVSKELDQFTASGDLGLQFTPEVALGNLSGADTFQLGAGWGYLVDERANVGVEMRVSAPLSTSTEPGTATPAEGYLTGRYRTDSGGHLTAALGTALSGGAGAANWRLLIGGGFGAGAAPPKDTDGDTFLDKVDGCVLEPEVVNSWKDDDGCPDALGTIVVAVTRDGEPALGATVGLWQEERGPVEQTVGAEPWTITTLPGTPFRGVASLGACLTGKGAATAAEGTTTTLAIPLEARREAAVDLTVKLASGDPVPGAQFAWADPGTDGCSPTKPEFTDANGHLGQKVGAGSRQWLVTADGYRAVEAVAELVDGQVTPLEVVLMPTKVQITREQIVILDKVFFETGKAIIKAESFGLLDEVAMTIRTHPEMRKVEIGGHTDSDGSDKANLTLSQARAASVVTYMVEHGVAAERLVAMGYGEAKPVMSNKTTQGKAQNRRVEFVITERAPDPE